MMSDRNAMIAANVRIEEVIWLPGATVGVDSGNAGLMMLLDRFPKYIDAPLFGALPQLKPFFGRQFETCDDASEEVATALSETPGFIFRAAAATMIYATPKPTYADWGSVWVAWLYAPDERSIARVAIDWARSREALDREGGRLRFGWSDRTPLQD